MRRKMAVLVVLLAAVAVLAAQMAQDKSKRPSPPGTAEVTLNGKKISIDYGRPKVSDPKTGQKRTIFGGLVPYDKVWRTGANEATTLTTEADLAIGNAQIPAGKYTLFSVPGKDKWTLIINKQTGQWGTEYDQNQDLARVDMQAAKSEQPVEQFTISFDKKSENAAALKLEWENTRAWVDVQAK